MLFTRYSALLASASLWCTQVVLVAMLSAFVVPTLTWLSSEPTASPALLAEHEGESVAPAPGPCPAPAEDAEDESPELEESLPWDDGAHAPLPRPLRSRLQGYLPDAVPDAPLNGDARPPEQS
jgi:hypothetical protein